MTDTTRAPSLPLRSVPIPFLPFFHRSATCSGLDGRCHAGELFQQLKAIKQYAPASEAEPPGESRDILEIFRASRRRRRVPRVLIRVYRLQVQPDRTQSCVCVFGTRALILCARIVLGERTRSSHAAAPIDSAFCSRSRKSFHSAGALPLWASISTVLAASASASAFSPPSIEEEPFLSASLTAITSEGGSERCAPEMLHLTSPERASSSTSYSSTGTNVTNPAT